MGRIRAPTRSKRGKELHTKRKDRKKIILAWVVIILMVASVFGIMLSGFGPTFENQVEISGYTFGQGVEGWEITRTPRGKSTVVGEFFLTLPYMYDQYLDIAAVVRQSNIPYISLNLSLINDSLELVRAQDHSRSVLAQTLFSLDVYAVGSLAESHPDADFPVVACDDPEYFVIEFVESNDEGIFYQDSCLKIQSKTPMSTIQFTDALRFALLQ
jgi:hypothetical protein